MALVRPPWSRGERKGEGVQGWNILFDPCLTLCNLLVFSSMMSEPSKGYDFRRCSLVDMSSDFGGEA